MENKNSQPLPNSEHRRIYTFIGILITLISFLLVITFRNSLLGYIGLLMAPFIGYFFQKGGILKKPRT
ncbi:MAG: hypothetical protein ACFFB5_20160 [Promethearchaeota archaeon]